MFFTLHQKCCFTLVPSCWQNTPRLRVTPPSRYTFTIFNHRILALNVFKIPNLPNLLYLYFIDYRERIDHVGVYTVHTYKGTYSLAQCNPPFSNPHLAFSDQGYLFQPRIACSVPVFG